MEHLTRDIATILGLTALFGFANHRFLRLPRTIGLVLVALAVSFAAIAIDRIVPGWGMLPDLRQAMQDINFADTLMQGMLSFLLFAGALHVNLQRLAEQKWAISALASIGLLTSTTIVGLVMFGIFELIGLDIPLLYCLIFGALISPTDPVAVLSILKTANVPPSLEAKIAGESLFNDGIGVVVFIILVGLLGAGQSGEVGVSDVAILFLQEAVGGAVLGFVAGWIGYRMLSLVDEFNLEIIITLALVTVSYEIAHALHSSGPIAVVVAGLFIGNHGKRYAMSETTREHLDNFWSVVDEILNAVLFLLIGLEVIVLSFDQPILLAILAAIPVVLLARFISVSVPITALKMLKQQFTKGSIPVLAWGGLRGGISVALALSLPVSAERDVLLTVCYGVVVFSIVVQGLTIERLVRRVVPPTDTSDGTEH